MDVRGEFHAALMLFRDAVWRAMSFALLDHGMVSRPTTRCRRGLSRFRLTLPIPSGSIGAGVEDSSALCQEW